MQCPICKKPIATEEPDRPESFPFCSDRCKLIDLGRWLSGRYQIPLDEPELRGDSDDSPPGGPSR
jgi:endogenous inhibitor of DNA gyrase (YacG/DUF329 family)